MKKMNIIRIAVLTLMACLLSGGPLAAQGKAKKSSQMNSSHKKIKMVSISAKVVDETGFPISSAMIQANEGSTTVFSDQNGYFTVQSKESIPFIIEAAGFETFLYDPRKDGGIQTITLKRAPLFSGSRDNVVLPLFSETKSRYVVGAISSTQGEKLEKYADPVLGNSLQGQILGLSTIMNAGGMGNNTPSFYIRGLHRENNNGVIFLVDGIERSVNELIAEEVESIEVLKDPTTKILYGARAANGVVLITTKKGAKHKRIIKVNAEVGVGLVNDYPDYINSYDYARLYNEARVNDGLKPYYSQDRVNGYKKSTGENDFLNPNVDYYNYFMRKNTGYRKATFEFSGGNEGAQYAFVGGYTGNSGLENVGETPVRDRFNARGNLQVKANDYISAFIGIAGVFDVTNRSSIGHGDVFKALSSHRPNEYPLTIPSNIMKADSSGVPALGSSMLYSNNLLGAMKYSGSVKDQYVKGQLNLGMNFDFNKLVKGLTGKVVFSLDNYFLGTEKLSVSPSSYAQRWYATVDKQTGAVKDTLQLVQRTQTVMTDQQTLDSTTTVRNSAVTGGLTYQTLIEGKHRLVADLTAYYYRMQQTGLNQDMQTANYSLRTNYAYRDKYIAEATFALMGSAKFRKGYRYLPTVAGGFAWIMSDEEFLKNNRYIDYLKVKASAGIIGYDGSTPDYLWADRWMDNGTVRMNQTLNPNRVTFSQITNPSLRWEKSREFNVGVEGLALNKQLWFEVNYFNEYRYDIITAVDSEYSALFGGLYPQMNWGRVRNQGIEAEIKYSNHIGDWRYAVGANLLYSVNKILRTDEINNPNSYLNKTGGASDVMLGYQSLGLFGKQVGLAGAPLQTFGPYGIGDIAYADLNGDNIIDENDRKALGNSYPRTQLGIDLNLNYKGFGLYMLGTAQLGVYSWLSNSYYWNFGEGKYSDLTLDRFHPTENPTGSYPRLTTTDGKNNFRNSSFWIENSSFFRLKNVELSYTFGYNRPLAPAINKVKVFVRGNNLLTLSKMKDLDPEVTGGGVNNYPLLMTLSGGVAVTF